MIAASSIHGTGAQNLAIAIRHGRMPLSGIAFVPCAANNARASSLVRPDDRDGLLLVVVALIVDELDSAAGMHVSSRR